jgi:hypothetical protein
MVCLYWELAVLGFQSPGATIAGHSHALSIPFDCLNLMRPFYSDYFVFINGEE